MSDGIVDLAAERARRRRIDPPQPASDTGEAIGLMGLASSAWLVGWMRLWMSLWVPGAPPGAPPGARIVR